MYGIEEYYEPDEILRDVDFEADFMRDDELEELSFDTGRRASERLSLMMEDGEFREGY